MPETYDFSLVNYRIEKSKDCLKAAKVLLTEGLYADSANRSYYAIFHAMNALCATKGVGFKKHSGVLSFFNLNYVKENIIEKEYSEIAKNAFDGRTRCDYSDFYVVSEQDVAEQYENAVKFVSRIEEYISNI